MSVWGSNYWISEKRKVPLIWVALNCWHFAVQIAFAWSFSWTYRLILKPIHPDLKCVVVSLWHPYFFGALHLGDPEGRGDFTNSFASFYLASFPCSFSVSILAICLWTSVGHPSFSCGVFDYILGRLSGLDLWQLYIVFVPNLHRFISLRHPDAFKISVETRTLVGGLFPCGSCWCGRLYALSCRYQFDPSILHQAVVVAQTTFSPRLISWFSLTSISDYFPCVPIRLCRPLNNQSFTSNSVEPTYFWSFIISIHYHSVVQDVSRHQELLQICQRFPDPFCSHRTVKESCTFRYFGTSCLHQQIRP